ncbi:MAG: cell division protein SepF [Thermoplasmatota archaeon]
MSIVKKIFGEPAPSKHLHKGDYLDLGEIAQESPSDGAATSWLRVVEVRKVEDLKEFAGFLFEGNVLLVDVKAVAQDEIAMKRITNELRKVAVDVNGDLAGIAEGLIAVTPAGVKVDRRKMRAAAASN